MNDSLNMDQINTLDTRKKHAYGDLELKYVYQFFIWSKKWQFLSGYFFFFRGKISGRITRTSGHDFVHDFYIEYW